MSGSTARLRSLVGLPVDGRPVVREQVQRLVEVAGWQLQLPEVAALGQFRRPANRAALRQWLLETADTAAGCVVSLDMLVYGGLVPSRFIADDEASLQPWLDTLLEIKRRHPARPVYAFAATMRISNNNIADEEKPYWAAHGEAIWRWSFHADRHTCTGAPDAAQQAAAAEATLPAAVRADYLATRARNHALTLRALALVAQGVIDRLVLPQDDTAAYGFNIAERRDLQQRVASAGLADRVLIYPGADEVLHTLCAQLVASLQGRPPLRVALAPSDPAGIAAMHALYEDRPVLDSVAAQVAAVGGVLVDAAENPELLLALHTQGAVQGDWAMQRPLPLPVPFPSPSHLTAAAGAPRAAPPAAAWLDRLARWQRGGGALAVADLAYANGGDPLLVHALASALPLRGLAAYAGWNTASNTLGGALAQAALAMLAPGGLHSAAHRHNLALRLAEDFLYQAVWRQVLRTGHDTRLQDDGADAETLRALAAALFTPPANAWLRAQQLGWRVEQVFLPWDRTFEIGLRLGPDA